MPKNFGGVGIKVQGSWHKFDNFLSWALGMQYKEGLKLNRFDIYKDFCESYFSEKTIARQRRNQIEIMKNRE